MKRIGYRLLWLAATGGGFCLLLFLAGWLVRGDVESERRSADPEDLKTVEKLRKTVFNKADPPRIALPTGPGKVDYSEGPAAEWYPKGESPILAELVKEGVLRPVAERVGPEPVVVRGLDEDPDKRIGKYGGTWLRVATSARDVGVLESRLSYANLVRWSPQGYPIVPHIARSFEVSDDSREFTFTLRKGMKWSDGQPFTAADIMYWWEHEALDTKISAALPTIMKVAGLPGKIEKLSDHQVRFVFPKPNGLFLARMATYDGRWMVRCPAHYLRDYHPTIGKRELIDKAKRARKLQSDIAVYRAVKDTFNPEHPRLWPWVYRTYKANPPQSFVRNPYYFMVDRDGNQLPYIDRLLFEVKSPGMIGLAAASGGVTMQARHIRYDEYTHLMSMRKPSGYEVRHWYSGERTMFGLNPNLNRKCDPNRPETSKKHALLNNKRFRQALSLAIDRAAIIKAEYNDQTVPAQCAPGPASFFYEESLYKAFTEYDPHRANRLLDEIGLTRRDYEGYRTFRDGSRMTFFLDVCTFTSEGPSQFLIDDWANVGVRVILRSRSRQLFATEQSALEHDIDVWSGNGEFMPLLQPRYFVPVSSSFFALGYAKWHLRGGLHGDPKAAGPGCIEPPVGHPLRKAMELYEKACAHSDRTKQRAIFREVLKIAAENVWTINVSTSPPVLAICDTDLRNVPRTAVYSWDFQSPGNIGIETYYFEHPHDSPGAVAEIKRSIAEVTPQPDSVAAIEKAAAEGGALAVVIRYTLLVIGVLIVVLVAVKHPYIGRRLLIMIPTLLIISVIVFIIIQLPPGDYVTTRIMQLMESGDEADLQEIEDLKTLFHLEDPVHLRYARWLGLYWFAGFDEADQGLLQGNMGRSMEDSKPVNDIIEDRLYLTIAISLLTILLTWMLAIPTGIYSAVKQYSIGDYVLTFIGFIGMCVPSFLLALILIYAADVWFDIKVQGLFSPQFGAQPEWDWPKVADLLKHVWVPVVVLGVGGTAGMIRVMRGNLLDELKKPYVVTARAKGVRPMKLLFKYPVRLALNPFISGIGGLFPMLVSGGAIVAMVLSLPTVGPLMLYALQSEDMYLAGSLLMLLSLLGVIGTLISDLLLLWLDPRIRFQGGSR